MHHRLSLLSDPLPLHLSLRSSGEAALTILSLQEPEPREVKSQVQSSSAQTHSASIGGFFRWCVRDGIWSACTIVWSLYPHILPSSLCFYARPSSFFYELGFKTTLRSFD
jgi:hypothetical protein